MIPESTKKAIKQKLYKTYLELIPLPPSSEIQGFGKSLLELVIAMFNEQNQKEHLVSLGYYAEDIKTCIVRYRVKGTDIDVVFPNLLTYEFLSDLMVYANQKCGITSVLLFSKYMRNIELAYGDADSAQFYNWLFHKSFIEPEYDGRQYYNLAAAGSVFLMFHELVHTDTELKARYAEILFEPADIQELMKGQENELIEEAICDFTSIAIIANYNLEKYFSCSKEEILKVSMLSLFLPSIYDLFLTFRKRFTCKDAEPKVKPIDILKSRFLLMSAIMKKAKLSGLFFEQYDIKAAMDFAGNTIEHFLWSLGELLQSDLLSEIDSFNLLTDEEKEEYSLARPERPWFLFA